MVDDFYFTELVYYIHSNTQHHKLINDFRNYQYSSYASIISLKQTRLKREEVIEWFGGLKLFEQYHLDKKHALIAAMDFEDFL